MTRPSLHDCKCGHQLSFHAARTDLPSAKWPSTRLAVLEGAVHGFGIDMLERWCAGLGVQITVAVRYVNTNGDVKVHSFTHGELKNEH